MFSGATVFDQNLESWNIGQVTNMGSVHPLGMFYQADGMSSCNKRAIHSSFEAQVPSKWPHAYDWGSLWC